MSKSVVQNFFPSTLALVVEHSWLLNYVVNGLIFPDEVAEICPEAVVLLSIPSKMGDNNDSGNIALRLPFLSVSALLGAWVGLKGGYELWHRQRSIAITHNATPSLSPPSTRLWSFAFWAFGMMNLSAVLLHCFLLAPIDLNGSNNLYSKYNNYTTAHPFWWACDCYMTGCSSVFLFLAALEESKSLILILKDDKNMHVITPNITIASSTASILLRSKKMTILIILILQICGWALQAVGAMCLFWFGAMTVMTEHLDDGGSSSLQAYSSFGLEQWYLLTPIVAGISVWCFFWLLYCVLSYEYIEQEQQYSILTTTVNKIRPGLFLCGLSCIIIIMGLILDLFACHLFLDAFTVTHGAFLGCDLFFGGLRSILLSTTTMTTTSSRYDDNSDYSGNHDPQCQKKTK